MASLFAATAATTASTAAASAAAAAATAAAAGGATALGTTIASTSLISSAAIAGSTALGAGNLALIGGVVTTGAGLLASAAAFVSPALKTFQLFGALDAIVSPGLAGQRSADIADINAKQTELDVEQKLLEGRETSIRALETLNAQAAHNITAGFASGIGLSPSVASSIDAITRKQVFNNTLSRTTTLLQAGSLQRKADLQRAQGQVARRQGVFESFQGVQKGLTLFDQGELF